MHVDHLKVAKIAAFSVSFKKTTCQVFGREGAIKYMKKGTSNLWKFPCIEIK